MLGTSAFVSGCGLGMALLGVAPFTPPNPFMLGLVLAVLQVRLGHTWVTRQLYAQMRRNVLEVKQASGTVDGNVTLAVKCDGGLLRTIHLTPASNSTAVKPAFAELIQSGSTFVYLDQSNGQTEAAEALNALLSSSHTVASEDLSIDPYPEEPKLDAEKIVQSLAKLTVTDLKKLPDKQPSPKASLAILRRRSQISAAVVATGGLVICLFGRYAAEQPYQVVAAQN